MRIAKQQPYSASNTTATAIIVIGATGGIGSALCMRLIEQAYHVFGLSTGTSHKQSEIDEHPAYTHMQTDLSDAKRRRSDFRSLLRAIDQSANSLSAVCAAAGIPAFGRIENISLDQTTSAIEINLGSIIDAAHIFQPALRKFARSSIQQQARPASFIVFGSEADEVAGTDGPVYCATKFGLRGFIESLRSSWSRDNIRISLISPGAVRTSFYDATYFAPGESPDNALTAAQCADAAIYCMNFPSPGGIDHIKLSPKTRVYSKRKS